MGAYEFDARSIIPEEWFSNHGLDASDPHVVSGNPDLDPYTTLQEWLANTDPTDPLSFFYIESIREASRTTISFPSSVERRYTLWSTAELSSPDWSPVPSQQAIPGTGDPLDLAQDEQGWRQFYRVEVSLP